MRQVEGTVVNVSERIATVEVTVHEGGCGRCHESGGCGGANVSRSLCASKRTLDVPNLLNAAVGDRVHIGIDERSLTDLANRYYVFPLLAFLFGAAAGLWALGSGSPVGSIAGAVLGGVVWFVVAKRNPMATPCPRMLKVEPFSRPEACLLPNGAARLSR